MLRSWPRSLFAFLVLALAALGSRAADDMFVFIDDDGVVHVSDAKTDARARQWSPGAFEKWALGQEATPHRGRTVGGASSNKKPSARARAARRSTPYDAMIEAAALRYDVRPALVRAVVMVESAFDPRAVSRAGACGLMQLMPATARDLGVKDVFDAEENVDGGTRYLAGLLRMFKDESLAVAAYNAGPGRVARLGRIPRIKETEAYVRSVLALASDLEAP